MQPLNLSNYKIKKRTRYDSIKELSERLGDPIGKWLKNFTGWEWEDIDKWILSVESKAKDDDISFQFAFNCMWKKKEVVDKTD